MRVFRTLVVAGVSALTVVGVGSAPVLAREGGGLVQFDSMTGITAAQTGVANDRGIKGGGLPWVIGPSSGEVSRHGSVEVSVRGLVIPKLGNVNPIKSFGATVSCLTENGVVNVSTGQFLADAAGNANIEARVKLPRDCENPEVFVVAPTGVWFAMANTGDQEQEGRN